MVLIYNFRIEMSINNKFLFILQLFIICTLSCTNTINFNNTNLHALVISDEAIEYQLNFTFSDNVNYEIGMITYSKYEQCNTYVDCNCHLKQSAIPSLTGNGENYQILDKKHGKKTNIKIPSLCYKKQTTPFSGYYYYCGSTFCGQCPGYKNRVLTIQIENYNLTNLNLTLEYAQVKNFSEEEMENIRRFKCPCRNFDRVNNELIIFPILIFLSISGLMLGICYFISKKGNESDEKIKFDVINKNYNSFG